MNPFQVAGKRSKLPLDKIYNKFISLSYKVFYRELKRYRPKLFELFTRLNSKAYTGSGYVFTGKNIYDFCHPNFSPMCLKCGKTTAWNKCKRTYNQYCSMSCSNSAEQRVSKIKTTSLARYGVSNPGASNLSIEKRKNTNLKRFGVENAFANPKIKKKIKQTMLIRYGVKFTSQSPEIQKKKSRNYLIKYGDTHHMKSTYYRKMFSENNGMFKESSKKKLAETNLRKYGVNCVFKSEKIKKKIAKTNMRRYGVPNPGARPSFRRKKYLDKFGITHIVQGYEPRALSYLESKDVIRIETKSRNLPRIRYKLGDIWREYYPDAYAVSKRGSSLLVETKSVATLFGYGSPDTFSINLEKFKAATKYMNKRGGHFLVLLFDSKKPTPRIVTDPKSKLDFKHLEGYDRVVGF